MTMADSARVMRSRDQQIYAEAVPRYRVGQFRLSSVPESFAIGTVTQPNRPNLQLMGLQVALAAKCWWRHARMTRSRSGGWRFMGASRGRCRCGTYRASCTRAIWRWRKDYSFEQARALPL
jgi:hypothetical protein